MAEIIIDGVRFISEDDLKSMAEHVRAKGGTTDLLTVPDGFNAAVDAIQTGGGAPAVETICKVNDLVALSLAEYNVTTSVVEEVK